MEKVTLSAIKRETFGKKTRFLRRQGLTPANIYGRNINSTSVQIETTQLKQTIAKVGTTSLISLKIKGEKNPKSVIIKDIQRHPITRDFIHVDLYQVRMDEKMKLEVPLELIGESPAVKSRDGIMIQNLSSIEVECLPADMPHKIEVDLSTLAEVDQALHVKDLTIGSGVHILTDPEKVLVVITGRRAMEIEEAVPKAVGEVEVVGEAEKEKEEAESGKDSKDKDKEK